MLGGSSGSSMRGSGLWQLPLDPPMFRCGSVPSTGLEPGSSEGTGGQHSVQPWLRTWGAMSGEGTLYYISIADDGEEYRLVLTKDARPSRTLRAAGRPPSRRCTISAYCPTRTCTLSQARHGGGTRPQSRIIWSTSVRQGGSWKVGQQAPHQFDWPEVTPMLCCSGFMHTLNQSWPHFGHIFLNMGKSAVTLWHLAESNCMSSHVPDEV